jgi:hypothetical protein
LICVHSVLEALWTAIESVPDPRKATGGPAGGTPVPAAVTEPSTTSKPPEPEADNAEEAHTEKMRSKKDKKDRKQKRKSSVSCDDVSWKAIAEGVLAKVCVRHCAYAGCGNREGCLSRMYFCMTLCRLSQETCIWLSSLRSVSLRRTPYTPTIRWINYRLPWMRLCVSLSAPYVVRPSFHTWIILFVGERT